MKFGNINPNKQFELVFIILNKNDNNSSSNVSSFKINKFENAGKFPVNEKKISIQSVS